MKNFDIHVNVALYFEANKCNKNINEIQEEVKQNRLNAALVETTKSYSFSRYKNDSLLSVLGR